MEGKPWQSAKSGSSSAKEIGQTLFFTFRRAKFV
jgi:hypothetical protein